MSGFDLGAAQGISEPEGLDAEPEHEESKDEQEQGGGFGKSIGQIFGGAGAYSGPQGMVRLHEDVAAPTAGGSLSSVQFGGSSSGGASAQQPMVPPGESAHAQFLNQHGRDANASLRGRFASQNGRSAQDVARQYGQQQ
jgi:hypothetical protein